MKKKERSLDKLFYIQQRNLFKDILRCIIAKSEGVYRALVKLDMRVISFFRENIN